MPASAGRAALMDERKRKMCLHPNAPLGCSRVGRAHTLQREGVLSQIVDSTGHVLVANTPCGDERKGQVSRVGWRDASTFPGFCSTHDSALFAPIERQPFAGSPQQTFLVGYRALSHELFTKRAAADGLTKSLDLVDRGRRPDEQRRIQERLGGYRAGVILGQSDNVLYKAAADELLGSGQYEQWGSAVFTIEGELSIASSGSATPSFDLNAYRIQDLSDLEVPAQALFFGIVSGPPGTRTNYVVFSWPPRCPAIEALVDSIIGLPPDRQGDALARFMLAHVENTYFAPWWWNSLSDLQQTEVLRLSALFFPEDEVTILGRPRLVDWRVVGSEVRRPGA